MGHPPPTIYTAIQKRFPIRRLHQPLAEVSSLLTPTPFSKRYRSSILSTSSATPVAPVKALEAVGWQYL